MGRKTKKVHVLKLSGDVVETYNTGEKPTDTKYLAGKVSKL
jgi:hypothetical protein